MFHAYLLPSGTDGYGSDGPYCCYSNRPCTCGRAHRKHPS